jgi:type IV pilus assembly protein PilO
MLEKLPFYGQVAVFVVLAAAIVFAAYTVWPDLGGMKEEIAKYEDQFAKKQAEIRKGLAAEQRLPELEREIAAKTQELSDLEQILPSDTETGDLLRYVKNLGDQSNLELKSFSPGGLKPAEFYKEFPIDMQVHGKYHDLALFLDRVSKYSRIINVDNLKIGSLQAPGKTIQASLTATTFVYTAEKGQKEGK